DALILAEGITQDNVSRLTPDAGKDRELVYRVWYFSGVLAGNGRTGGANAFCFAPEKTGRADFGFEDGGIGASVISRSPIFLKQRRCHHVDSLVGALRAKNCRNQKLERIPEVELAMRVRVNVAKPLRQPLRAFTR